MFPAQGPGAPQQQAAPPQQGSPWAPPQQPGFAPPQQQGFGQRPAGPPPGAPPNPYAPPPQQPPVNPYGATAAPYGAPPQANPYGAPPQANPYPPQGQGYPPPPQQQPYGAPPATAAPSMAGSASKKSSKGLVIGLAVAAVAIAGGVVAFVMLRGGSAAAGGSRSDVVKGVLAAMADGSVDDLVKFSDPKSLYAKIADCDGKSEDDKDLSEKDKEERDPDKVLAKQRKEFADIVKQTKGLKIELVEIVGKEPPAPTDAEKKSKDKDDEEGEKDRGMVMAKGDRLMKGCVAKVPVRVMQVKLKVKVTPPKEEASEQETEMFMVQVGKGWWMMGPPSISAGAAALLAEVTRMKDEVCACKEAACAKKLSEEFKDSPRRFTLKKQIKALSDEDRDKIKQVDKEMDACEKKLTGGDAIAALTQFKDKMCACQDKACAEKVTQEMTVWAKSHMDDEKPDSEQMSQATEITEQLSKCMTKAYEDKTGGGIGATIGEAGGTLGGSSGLGPECTAYKGMIKRLAECPKMPQQSRDSMTQALKTMEDAWKNYDSMPESAKKATEDACRQGGDALKGSLSQLGC